MNHHQPDKAELLSGVGIDLTLESKQLLFKTIEEFIPQKDFYKSSDLGYSYINGNVTNNGHLTICFNVKNPNLYQQFISSGLNIKWPRNAVIKEIQVNLGWQNLYYVVVAIPQLDNEIYKFDNWIRSNNQLLPDSPIFDPHIALCYIKNTGVFLKELFEKLKKQLIGKTVNFESVNFYQADNKVGTIKL